MKYPPVPLLTELTLPIFFCLSLPYVLILIIIVIWLRLLLNEEEMPPAEETKKQSADVSHSESKSEDEPTDDESQNDTASTDFEEDEQLSGPVGQPRPKPAYLSSKPKANCHLRRLVSEPKIRPSHVERSVLCNIMMLLCSMFCSLTWTFLSHLLQICNVLRTQLLPSSLVVDVARLCDLLRGNVVKILGSPRLQSRGLLTSILGTRYKKTEQSAAQRNASK
ncbi:uncharacterized protein LOC101749666 isoform X1 [Gallus gallus]|uniref:uncharacterized protein LOC101749666 isoform X1 n=2 Tax=Gallus gallus TaxID=9031 RepID=UPI001F00CB86|nr:uncharacterized protein LOC101749666 isoform X1 [Gallus gallus]